MMTPSTILLLIIAALLGVALGAFLQYARERRRVPPRAQTPISTSLDEMKPDSGKEVEELRILRTHSGRILLDLDGSRQPDGEPLRADQRRRLGNLLIELRPWLEGSKPVPTAAPSRKIESPISPGAVTARSETAPVKPATALKSIVEQINDVLQARLQDSPFRDRDIRLAEGPMGEVLVMVGLIKYEGIEAVPEPGIQKLIRQSVAEWEKSVK